MQPAAVCEVLNECRWALFDYDPPRETIKLSERVERESLLARSPYFLSEALMTLAIDQLRLGHQAGAEAPFLHAIRRTAGIEIDLVEAEFGADFCASGKRARIGAAKL